MYNKNDVNTNLISYKNDIILITIFYLKYYVKK